MVTPERRTALGNLGTTKTADSSRKPVRVDWCAEIPSRCTRMAAEQFHSFWGVCRALYSIWQLFKASRSIFFRSSTDYVPADLRVVRAQDAQNAAGTVNRRSRSISGGTFWSGKPDRRTWIAELERCDGCVLGRRSDIGGPHGRRRDADSDNFQGC